MAEVIRARATAIKVKERPRCADCSSRLQESTGADSGMLMPKVRWNDAGVERGVISKTQQSGSAIGTKQLRQTAALLPDGRRGWVATGSTGTTKARFCEVMFIF